MTNDYLLGLQTAVRQTYCHDHIILFVITTMLPIWVHPSNSNMYQYIDICKVHLPVHLSAPTEEMLDPTTGLWKWTMRLESQTHRLSLQKLQIFWFCCLSSTGRESIMISTCSLQYSVGIWNKRWCCKTVRSNTSRFQYKHRALYSILSTFYRIVLSDVGAWHIHEPKKPRIIGMEWNVRTEAFIEDRWTNDLVADFRKSAWNLKMMTRKLLWFVAPTRKVSLSICRSLTSASCLRRIVSTNDYSVKLATVRPTSSQAGVRCCLFGKIIIGDELLSLVTLA